MLPHKEAFVVIFAFLYFLPAFMYGGITTILYGAKISLSSIALILLVIGFRDLLQLFLYGDPLMPLAFTIPLIASLIGTALAYPFFRTVKEMRHVKGKKQNQWIRGIKLSIYLLFLLIFILGAISR